MGIQHSLGLTSHDLLVVPANRTALRFAEAAGHDEVACILRVDPAVCTIQEAAAAGRVSEVWALMRQASHAEVGRFRRGIACR